MTTSLERMLELAGVPVTKKLVEARNVPSTRSELAPKNARTMGARVEQVAKAKASLEDAIKALENVPAIDFMGDVPHYISEIEMLLRGHPSEEGETGLNVLLTHYKKEFDEYK